MSNLSVVIPTLGGATLNKTINCLNSGTIIPDEILVCLPSKEYDSIKNINVSNVKIIECKKRGQVYQRMCGFKTARFDYVLQLDDDLNLDKYCIEELLNTIKKHNKASIAPFYFDINTNKYYSFITNDNFLKPNKFWNLIADNSLTINSGRITKSGINYGFDVNLEHQSTDWLPGGCILHKKENLVLYDYYRFKGKAYLEDLYHSKILQNNNITLFVCKLAKCNITFDDKSEKKPSISTVLVNLFRVFKIRVHFNYKYNYSIVRMFLFQIFLFYRSILRDSNET